MNIQQQIEYAKQKWYNIKYIDNPCLEVQLEAVRQNGYAIKYINNPYKEVQLEAIKHDIWVIEYIDNPCLEVQLKAVKQNGNTIIDIDNPFKEVKKHVANNIDFNQLLQCQLDLNIDIQQKIKDYITKEIYYKSPKDFPWIPEIKEKFKDIDRFKRFNL